ncbi:MAG TPA: hypothetical protein VMQ93_19465, partial [Novosphingobium sp.]|nr:hypothetical protein [Novosphingobium sp.]
MRKYWISAVVMAGMVATPAMAGQEDKAITNRDPNAVDVAKTPIDDLNVGRDREIPPLLIAATSEPYTLKNLGKCR